MTRPIQPQVPNTPGQPVAQKKAAAPSISAGQKQTVDKTKNIEVAPLSPQGTLQPHQFQRRVEKTPTRVTAKAAAALNTSPAKRPLDRLRTLRQMALPKTPLKAERKHLVAVGAPGNQASKSTVAAWRGRTGH